MTASWLDSREAGVRELAGILMLKVVSKLTNSEACLHFLTPKCPHTKVGSRHHHDDNSIFEKTFSKILIQAMPRARNMRGPADLCLFCIDFDLIYFVCTLC